MHWFNTRKTTGAMAAVVGAVFRTAVNAPEAVSDKGLRWQGPLALARQGFQKSGSRMVARVNQLSDAGELSLCAGVVELADTQDLKSCGGFPRTGSSPVPGTDISSI